MAENQDGSLCARIPVAWIKINPTKQLSEEQRREIVRKIKGLKVLSRTRTKHDKFGFIAQNRDKNVRQSNVRNY